MLWQFKPKEQAMIRLDLVVHQLVLVELKRSTAAKQDTEQFVQMLLVIQGCIVKAAV